MEFSNSQIQIKVPEDITERLIEALRKAGIKEIGGILMGEHESDNTFIVRKITVQRYGGTFSSFVRVGRFVILSLRRFFKDTGYDYARYNYLGEWHSHPSFSTIPSIKDCDSMWDLVEDNDIGARFAVLMILKLNESRSLEGSVTIFLPRQRKVVGELIQEG